MELPEALHQFNPADLLAPLRQQQASPDFEILDWTVQPLSHEKIIATTGGLFHFSGQGRDQAGTRDWSLVLKILSKPDGKCLEPEDWCFWKREMLAFDSGLLASLPPGISVPGAYGAVEHENSAWIWMEHLSESTERIWSLDHYRRAAYEAGRSAGAYLTGHPLPDQPWFPSFFRSIYRKGDWWATVMDPQTPESAWNDPLVQQHFSEPLRSQILSIWRERERFYAVQERLPQVLCHNDFHRRNLMFCAGDGGQEELFALDWAFVGRGAVGSDLGELIASSMYFNEIDPVQAAALEAVVMEGYLAGLSSAGWQGDPRLPRLGYLLAATFWMGASLPGWTVFMQLDFIDEIAMYGYPADQLVRKWVTLSEFLMTRTDEARQLIEDLGLG